MSLTVFFAICILGCDFMIFVLFKWLYGDKRRKPSKRSALGKAVMPSQSPLYYFPARRQPQRNATGKVIYGGFGRAELRGHGAAQRGELLLVARGNAAETSFTTLKYGMTPRRASPDISGDILPRGKRDQRP